MNCPRIRKPAWRSKKHAMTTIAHKKIFTQDNYMIFLQYAIFQCFYFRLWRKVDLYHCWYFKSIFIDALATFKIARVITSLVLAAIAAIRVYVINAQAAMTSIDFQSAVPQIKILFKLNLEYNPVKTSGNIISTLKFICYHSQEMLAEIKSINMTTFIKIY